MATMATKQEILDLLDDNEVARVARAEEEVDLADGDEYVDLDHLDDGIQHVKGRTRKSIHSILPKSMVSEKTWQQIQSTLSS